MRMILADPHPQALWALKTMLQEKPGFEVIGDAIDAESLLVLAAIHPPDLILIDMGLPGRSIEDLITALHSNKLRPIVVVMSTKPEYGRMMLKAGADAFVSKGDQPEWLLETLEKYIKPSRKMDELVP
jgi:DNA-binding NarL/FixJ family response regulator